MFKNLFLALSLLALTNRISADKVEPRWVISAESKGTSRNEVGDRQSASEVNVKGLEEEINARSIAKGDRNTKSQSIGDSLSQSNLNFADAKSDAEQDGVGTTLANSELTTKFLQEGEENMPVQGDDEVRFERAGGFPTEASLSDTRRANNRA